LTDSVENMISVALPVTLSDSATNAAARPRLDRAALAAEAEVLELFDRLRERLLGYLLRFGFLSAEDSEDVVQEAFFALYQHLQRGRSRENLTGWLFRVVHNLGLRRAQSSRRDSLRTVLLTDATSDMAVDAALNPEAALADGQARRRLQAVVRALPEQDQHCLALRAEGLRYRDIAEVLDISLGSVAKSLERSLERIARAAGR
jgi:RNA polymerase sigma-70 factor (ECF subfamily)